MWTQLNSGAGYWNVFVWLLFFAGMSCLVLWLRSFGRHDYMRNTLQDDIYWSGNEVPEDGAKISVPASASYWGFRVAAAPVYAFLDRLHNGSASDYAGYFVVTAALIGALVLAGGR
ncbi:MAG: hydrogenase [Synergistaceae bacterium]|jgi:hypothetical protein|nr:hydrogenase [Synergistaceae bacterium]